MMRGAMMKTWITFLGLMLVCCGLRAQDATDRLLEALDGMQDLQGNFTQRQYGQNGVLLVESRGRCCARVILPGKSRYRTAS